MSTCDHVTTSAPCGHDVNGNLVLFEVRFSVKHPTSAMIRQVIKGLEMQAGWFEEEEKETARRGLCTCEECTSLHRECVHVRLEPEIPLRPLAWNAALAGTKEG